MSAEIKQAGDVNDANVAKHIAGKFDVNKLVGSSAAQNAKYGDASLLFWSAYGGHKASVAALLKAGAKKDLKAKTGETALQIAERKGHEDVFKLLGGVVKPKPAAASAPAAAAKAPAAAAPAKAPAAAAKAPAAAAKAPAAAAPAKAPAAAAATKPGAAPVKPVAAKKV